MKHRMGNGIGWFIDSRFSLKWIVECHFKIDNICKFEHLLIACRITMK